MVSWTERKANEWINEKAEVAKIFWRPLKVQLLWTRDTPALCMDKEIIQGTIRRQWRSERPRMPWLDNITAWFGVPLELIVCMAAECNEW